MKPNPITNLAYLFILPMKDVKNTNDKGQLFLNADGVKSFLTDRESIDKSYSWFGAIPQSVFITTVDQAEKDDYIIIKPEIPNTLPTLHKVISRSEKYYDVGGSYGLLRSLCTKVIATSEENLIKFVCKNTEHARMGMHCTCPVEERFNNGNKIARIKEEFLRRLVQESISEVLVQYKIREENEKYELDLNQDGTLKIHELSKSIQTSIPVLQVTKFKKLEVNQVKQEVKTYSPNRTTSLGNYLLELINQNYHIDTMTKAYLDGDVYIVVSKTNG